MISICSPSSSSDTSFFSFSDDDNNSNDDSNPANISQQNSINPLINSLFLPPKGHLQHPYIGWIVDEVTMNAFMQNWPKQEGFAVTKTTNNVAIYWRCVHHGKYRNRYNLPAEVTEKSKCQGLLNNGISFVKIEDVYD